MLVTGVIFGFVALGFSCWLLFALAVNALPFFVGVTAGLAAYQSGLGAIGAIIVSFIASIDMLAIGQIAFRNTRSREIRIGIALLFAAPAAVAGYHATLGLAHIGASSQGWQETFAFIGALVVGGTAWARMRCLPAPEVERRGVVDSPPQSFASASRDG